MAASKPTKKTAKPVREGYAGKHPSPYGSHTSMVSEEWTAKLSDSNFAVLEGDDGFYATERTRLDTGLADSYRFASPEFRAAMLRKLLVGVRVVQQEDKVNLTILS